MRILTTVFLVLLAPGLILAQSSAPRPDSTTDNATVANELKALREALAEQQKQIARQQQEIDRLKQQQAVKQDVSANATNGVPRIMDAALHTTTPAAIASPVPNRSLGQGDAQKPSPLSFKIGAADFTPGGFVDFETIFRSTNTGNVVGTNFNAIPFSNTVAGHLTETRMTAQASRFNMKVTDKFGENDVTAFVEFDFNGNDPANVFVNSNSHTNRLRHYWLDLKRGKWEFMGGQAWSWLTPNRVGVSPASSDVFTPNVDHNYQVGLTWTRGPQFRLVYHPNTNWAFGVALENPQQYIGAGAEVSFPAAFNAALTTQFDAANNNGTPNVHPDIIPKIAYDTDVSGRHFHVEAVGLLTTVKATAVPTTPGATTFQSSSKTGGGVSAAVNLELVKNFRVVANGFLSDGGGRYIFGLGPDVVVRPVATTPSGFTIAPSLVHSSSAIFGFEAQVNSKTLLAGYYGGAYFRRNTFPDITAPNLPNPIACAPGFTATLKPCIGFGGTNSPNIANRSLQQATLDWTQTFWKNPQYGTLQLLTQYSYVTRAPWFVAAGAPKNAHLSMGWVALRFILP